MIRRLFFLIFVIGLAGTAGLSVGLLYAPAPGEDTRRKLSEVFEEHGSTFTDLFALGRDAFNYAVEAVSGIDASTNDI